MKRDRGFTLIEALFVCAIAAILAGTLTPVLIAAKIRAKSASCMNNLKQIGHGFQLYAQDNEDDLPPYVVSSIVGGTTQAWQQLSTSIKPYGPTRDTFRCPLDNGLNDWGSYEENLGLLHVGRQISANPLQFLIKFTDIDNPTSCYIFFDRLVIDGTGFPRRYRSAHGSEVNNLFADGHCAKTPIIEDGALGQKYHCDGGSSRQ